MLELIHKNGRTWLHPSHVILRECTQRLTAPALKLAELSQDARRTADKLEFLQDEIRQAGVALALVRRREAHGERGALPDLKGAASVLRAYAAILERNLHLARLRAKKKRRRPKLSLSPPLSKRNLWKFRAPFSSSARTMMPRPAAMPGGPSSPE